MLKLEHVGKQFKNGRHHKAVVEDISLDIKPGEFVVLIGPSGCGKSTLLKIMAGLEKPTTGTIMHDDMPALRPNQKRGVIFQQFALFPWLTVFENIAFALRLRKTSEEEIKKTVNRYCNLTGLTSVQHQYPHTLSGGMQQRVAIARTLANNSEIILLDEPFGSLDVQTRSQMQEFLANLWEEERKTMVMVTHDIEEAIYLADRIVVMETKPGRIKEIVVPNFARPRNPDIKFSQEFVDLKKHLSYIIQSEAMKAAWDSSKREAKKPIRIGINVWPGTAALHLGQDLGYFAEANLDIELVNVEKHAERHEAWQADDIDLLDTTLDTAVLLKETVPDLKIVLIKDVSYGGDALLARNEYKNISDLRGKTVAVEKGWVSHFFLLYLLHQNGMSSRDVYIADMKSSNIGSAIIAGKVDGGVVWEPWLSKTLELSDTHILADTREHKILYDCIVAKKSFLEQNPDLPHKLASAWKQSLQYLREQPNESEKIISSYVGTPQREIANQLQKLTFIESPHTSEILDKINTIQQVVLPEGLLSKEFDPQELIGY